MTSTKQLGDTALTDEAAVEERLSRPTGVSVQAMQQLDGDLLILGAGGKMGPSLARLARRSVDESGRGDLKVIAVSRFLSTAAREQLDQAGVETIACDLLDEDACRRLPETPNVLFMFGHKFSGSEPPSRYWAMNAYVPGMLALRYRRSRIVCFSSGNVYPFTAVDEAPPTEATPPAPLGEYATTVWGRERLLEFVSHEHRTPVCLLRLNYAVEPRYGVLIDLGERILAGEPIDLAVPEVNFIWQGHANAVALASFAMAASPAAVLNLTGPTRHRVRDLAVALGKSLGTEPIFAGEEGDRALVSDATLCRDRYGPGEVDDEALIAMTAAWLKSGGRTLGKPTKFHVRDGRF